MRSSTGAPEVSLVSTVCDSAVDVLAENDVVPRSCPAPPRVWVASTVAPSVKVTVPVGVAPATSPVTVAVNVTD